MDVWQLPRLCSVFTFRFALDIRYNFHMSAANIEFVQHQRAIEGTEVC